MSLRLTREARKEPITSTQVLVIPSAAKDLFVSRQEEILRKLRMTAY